MDKTKGTRFKVVEFINPSGQVAWRVSGYRRNRERIRENFATRTDARSRATELEIDWLGGDVPAMPKVTRLDHERLAVAERAFDRLGEDAVAAELLRAVEFYLEAGRPKASVDVPRLDDAAAEFNRWLDAADELRPASKRALHQAVRMLSRYLGNPRVNGVTVDAIEEVLGKMGRLTAVSKSVYRRGWSRFFSWCIDRPRRWLAVNPVAAAKIDGRRNGKPSQSAPVIITVDQARRLMGAAETVADGRMAPWFALALFGGLRPVEAARVGWAQVNLEDGEIRLEEAQTKDGRSRVITICPTLSRWLTAHRDKPVVYSRRHFRAVVEAAGLAEWRQDVLRHTAASHRLRQLGSYARVADEFGNSEAMLKRHYAGRVTSAETEEFYGIMPKGKKGEK